MASATKLACVSGLFASALLPGAALAQDYRIERIASGLNQPTYVTQAPGDPANILYFTERTRDANPGFTATNVMGKVYRYDLNTRTKTSILDLSGRGVTGDLGLQTIAFSPDFNNVGTPGYQKFYVSSSQDNTGNAPISRVEEYTYTGVGQASLSRTILQYNNLGTQDNHTVNWVGFDPTATGVARNYLYVSTGDGNFGSTNRPSQDPSDIRGKMLRVDVVGADSYPGGTPGSTNANKNFAIPADNPLPTYNAANPGAPITGLGEVFLTGLRNASRVSFDRTTGDMYIGDVGENVQEELDFLKAGSNASGPPVDYGWPRREGTANGISTNTTPTNTFTGVSSQNPILQFASNEANGNAIIGGYRYAGPVASLGGKYFYSDFAQQKVFSFTFDRNTPPGTFQGNNGTLTEMSGLWESLVTDPSDPSYTAGVGAVYGLDHIVSWGEDNAGNVYLVDFGPGTGFTGQYPGAGLGEIFRITPIPEPATAAALVPAMLLLRRRRRHTCR